MATGMHPALGYDDNICIENQPPQYMVQLFIGCSSNMAFGFGVSNKRNCYESCYSTK
jgi:hypothetical protein